MGFISAMIFGFLLPLLASEGMERPLLVQILFRHGDRTPYFMIRNDPYQAESWPDGLGQLTSLGIWHSFKMGRFFKKRYIDELSIQPAEYNAEDIYIRSTDYDRTIMTAQCVLAGMFPVQSHEATGNSFRPHFSWRPIPVHTVSLQEEKLLLPYNCPKYVRLSSELLSSSREWKEFLYDARNKIVIDRVINKTGAKIEELTDVYDTLKVELENNLTLATWITKETVKVLKNLTFLFWKLKLAGSNELRRLSGVGLFGKLLDEASNRAKNAEGKKMILYSAHDDTILALLGALLYDFKEMPDYNAFLTFELYRGNNSTGGPYLKVFYRDNSKVEPIELTPIRMEPCPETDKCPLDKVVDFYDKQRHLVVRDVDAECKDTTTTTTTTITTTTKRTTL